jgi:ribosomal protein S16
MSRITKENEALLKRLQDKSSHYNVVSWEGQRRKQEKMIKSICYYPPSIRKKTSRSRGSRIRGGLNLSVDPNTKIFNLY